MDESQELAALRRLEELERKAASQDLGEVRKQKQAAQANVYAGQDVGQMGAMPRALGGAKTAWDRAAMGLKGMFTDLTPEDKVLLAGGKAFVDQGGTAASVGDVLGDVAITAAPAVRGFQAVKTGATMLPRALQFVGRNIPAAAISGGVTAAALAPEDRGKAGAVGAAGASLGEAGGRLLTKTLGGLVSDSVTPAAKQLMDQGANVPMWKATESRILRNVAERARALPVAGDIIKTQERAGIESWNKLLSKEATPPTPVLDETGRVLRWETKPVTQTGTQGLNELAGRFDEAYGALYGNRGVPVDFRFGSDVANLVESTKRYFPGVAGDVEGIVNKVTDNLLLPDKTLGGVVSYNSVKQSMDDVNKAITSAWRQGNAEKAEALSGLRDALTGLRTRGLPPEVQSQAGEINKAYAKFKTIERAASGLGAQKAGGVVTPDQMLNSIKARDKTPDKSAFARGNAPGQQQALTAQQVYGNTLPEVGPGTAEKLLPLLGFGLPMVGADLGATALLGTQTGQRALMGQLPGQSIIRRKGEEYLVPALRAYGTSVSD